MTKKNKKSKKKWIIGIILVFLFLTIQAINYINNFAHLVRQSANFFFIDISLEFFNSEFNGYPPSDGLDPNGIPYCGAMKLTEALVGQDLLGCHKNSTFKSDGKYPNGNKLYDQATYDPNSRKGPYIPLEEANAFHLNEIFKDTGSLDENKYVLCDVFFKKRYSGNKIGMPILYYKADTTKSSHDKNNPDNPDNIYNYKDNYDLLALGVPGKPGAKHPLYEDPSLFYIMTQNYKVTSKSMPFNKDTYILISAGPDGLYGTKDDIVNLDNSGWRKRKQLATENTTEGAIGKETHSKNE